MLRKRFLQMGALAALGMSMPRGFAHTINMLNPIPIAHPVIIIGSAYGAAVSALRLTPKRYSRSYIRNGDGLDNK